MTTGTTKTGQPLITAPFAAQPILIPEFRAGKFTGMPYKIERVLRRGDPETDEGGDPETEEGGAREHLWFAPDLRPHNHPWTRIWCKVLHGWYRANEWRDIDGAGQWDDRIVTLRAGDPEHVVDHDTYHAVIEVMPGTHTVMTFGAATGEGAMRGRDWNHLEVPENGDGMGFHIVSPAVDGEFMDAYRHLNPSVKRPEGWVDRYAHMPVPTIESLIAGLG